MLSVRRTSHSLKKVHNSCMKNLSTTNSRLSSSAPNAPDPPRPSVKLPRLPVPDLRKTLDKYLASLQPFLLEDEARGGEPYEQAYTRHVECLDEFESGIGRVCQERLIALDKASPRNWLDDNFWLNKAYLEWRAPLLVNSNWWLAFLDDEHIYARNVADKAKAESNGMSLEYITPMQIRRAAWLLHRTLEFKTKLDAQEVHPDTSRTGIWFRENAAKMFNHARIPKQTCDILSPVAVAPNPSAFKVIVNVHNWFYTVTVFEAASNLTESAHRLLSAQELERRLSDVVSDAARRYSSGERAVPIGVLSSDERDKWAENLDYLLRLSPENTKVHQTIVDSLMSLSLDTESHASDTSSSSAATFQHNLDDHLHSIRSTKANVSNRFFDKPYTLIVDSSTRAGAMGEHSPCDALIPSMVAEYAVVQDVDDQQLDLAYETPLSSQTTDRWERLEWIVDDKIRLECGQAQERAEKIIDNSDNSVFWFTNYGADWIKGVGKLSADAYIQMALQLAWYRTRGEFTATYETALTRMFDKGRTETIRTLTRDSRAFVLAMLDPSTSVEAKALLLHRAIQAHSSLTREAATGRGVDRHLLGLRLMLRSEDGERAALFDDGMFDRSSRWKLSTSGLSAGHLFRGTGFGAMYDDGYGINYLAAPDMVKFGIESKRLSPLTSTDKFKDAVVESMLDLQQVAAVRPSSPVTSRL